jgi:microcystin-dependent protein
MADPFLGEIRIFAGDFAPTGWAFCNGQLLPIAQNTALFSLLGTQYGGDGRSTFGLPNLQGASPMDFGNGAGLTPRSIGESGGESAVTLQPNQMATHGHAAMATAGAGNQIGPAGSQWAEVRGLIYSPTADGQLAPSTLAPTGGNQPHNNLPPYLTLSFIIAMQGIFPARS